MAVDTPARIAVLGAGPIGVEVALYARFLGYDVVWWEREQVGTRLLSWGHASSLSPFGQLSSPLGLAALRAQDEAYVPPPLDLCLTGRQWLENYVLPLSQTDLLVDHLRLSTTVLAVGKERLLRVDSGTDDERGEEGFRILVQQSDGTQDCELADVVIDCTGLWGPPCGCGPGGIPARGELRCRDRIEYALPDVRGAERDRYIGRRVLVVGDGLAALATMGALADLMTAPGDTHVTWSTPRLAADSGLSRFLPESAAPLLEVAMSAATAGDNRWQFRPNTYLEAMQYDADAGQFLVWFDGEPHPERFDRLIADLNCRPDRSLYAELRVDDSPITEGPAGVAAALGPPHAASRGDVGTPPPERLLTAEPDFYVIGSKSYGRDRRFQFVDGLRQIRDLFGIIGDRAELDLYATSDRLPH